MSHRILVTEPIVAEPLNQLREQFRVDIGERAHYDSEEHLIADIGSYDAVLTMLSNPVTGRVIEAADNLKIIANMAAGYDNVDIEVAEEAGIFVANTPGVLTDATADAGFALLLAAARRIPEAQQFVREGQFDGWHPLGFLGTELSGSTLGILGMGRIGMAVAERAVAFGMNIIYHNRTPLDTKTEQQLDARYIESVHQLALESDILSLNCPLNEESHHAIDRRALEALGKDGILVNTARGAVVDEEALIEALNDEVIGGAALDVFEQEPEIPDELFEAPNCIMTPHIGSATHKTRNKMGHLAANSIEAALEGKTRDRIPNLVV